MDIINRFFGSAHTGEAISAAVWGARTLYALALLASFCVLIVGIAKLSHSGDSPAARAAALKMILTAGICIAIFGSFGLVYLALMVFVA